MVSCMNALRKKLRVLWRRSCQFLLGLFACYISVLVLGLIPMNIGFKPPRAGGVTIYVVSSSVHADLFLPVRFEEIDWNDDFKHIKTRAAVPRDGYMAIGWGDRGFYLETPTWSDLKLTTAANALLVPSAACIHIDFTSPKYFSSATPITISAEQYRALVSFVRSSIKRDQNGLAIPIEGYAYGYSDGFIEAHGSYHLLNTCNSWIGRALAHSGVTTPWLTPLPHMPTLYVSSEPPSTK